MSYNNKTITQIIQYPNTDSSDEITQIERKIELVDISCKKNDCIKIGEPGFDLFVTFSSLLIRSKQKFKLLDEFCKLYLKAITVLDRNEKALINKYEKQILNFIIDDNACNNNKSEIKINERPLCKKALIKDDLCILKHDNLLILYKKSDWDREKKHLLEIIPIFITLFKHKQKN